MSVFSVVIHPAQCLALIRPIVNLGRKHLIEAFLSVFMTGVNSLLVDLKIMSYLIIRKKWISNTNGILAPPVQERNPRKRF